MEMETFLAINCHIGHAELNVDITGKMFNVCRCLGGAAAAASSQFKVFKAGEKDK